MKFKYIIYSLIVSITLLSCAQIGSLSGGEKDTIPPVFLKGKPENKSLNFDDDKILLTFDEFFQLNNLNGVFLSSPPFDEKPEFELKRKSLLIKLNSELHDTTTYSFLFGDAIEDYHERNPLEDFKFVFSTGDFLDTMEISGKVLDAQKLKGIDDMYVMLYKNYTDSVPLLEKPYYIAKTDTAGEFKVDYIKSGKYKIFALIDKNADLKFNLPNEKIAFLDSLIVPGVETKITIDSIKAGTVLHIGEEDVQGDTLKNDTVITTYDHTYSPKNLKLFAFFEDKQKQYLISSSRDEKGKCTFDFSKAADSVKMYGLNFSLEQTEHFTEFEDSSRRKVIWLKDSIIYNIDSLSFTAEYYNLDSLENRVKDIDTISLMFDVASDTLVSFLEFSEMIQSHDSFSNYKIQVNSVIDYIDTSKIKLFRLFDTLVVDTKKQEILKSIRPEPDRILFSLRRPIVEKFELELPDVDSVENWYTKSFSGNDTIIECKITEKSYIEKDTLKLVVHYDNNFFFDQIQSFSDTILFPLYKQSLLKVSRPSIDTLEFSFKKEVNEDTKISIADSEKDNWYTVIDQDDNEKMHVKITDREIIEKDSLILTVRTKDYDNTLGDLIYFEYSKNSIYVHKQRTLNSFKRPEKDKFYFIFSEKPKNKVKFEALNFNDDNEWLSGGLIEDSDTLFYSIINNSVSRLDTLKLKISYDIINRDNSKGSHIDTLNLIYKRQRRAESNRDKQQQQTEQPKGMETTVSIEVPETYNILNDSISERNFLVHKNWLPGISYILRLDSGAINDTYGDKSSISETKFEIRTKDFYGKIVLSLSNIKRISDKDFYLIKNLKQSDSLLIDSTENNLLELDSVVTDSAHVLSPLEQKSLQDSIDNSVLDKGKVIIYLYNKDQKLIEKKDTKKDSILIFNRLAPDNYTLKLIYDVDESDDWDTGDYLKNRQPERLLIYPSSIVLESNWENEVDWKIETPK